MSSDRPKYCKGCKELQTATKHSFDCSECDFNPPRLLFGSKLAMKLYNLSRSQRNYHSGGLAGFDYPAIRTVAEINNINLNPMLFSLMWILEGLEMEAMNKDVE